MNLILVKMFATALALAQVTTRPDAVKTEFDPIKDRGQVVQLLRDGCAHMRKAFDIEDLNLDDLIETALEDPTAVTGEIKAFRGINFGDLHVAYKEFCGKDDDPEVAASKKAAAERRAARKAAAEKAAAEYAAAVKAAEAQRAAERAEREAQRAAERAEREAKRAAERAEREAQGIANSETDPEPVEEHAEAEPEIERPLALPPPPSVLAETEPEDAEFSRFNIREIIAFYNQAVADLPDHNKLKGIKLPGTSVVLDGKGERFAELFESDHRRTWVPLSAIPEYVQQAFIAAEDKRFYQHKGVDERGLIRAFISNLAQPGRPQGGSTITQQVAKNLLVGDDVSYERKIREMIVAARLDRALDKKEILEVYLNSIFLGRGSWGIDMAARSYFKKPASALTLTEGAMLASMAKGPAYFSPDRFPERTRDRFGYVLKRMEEEKIPGTEHLAEAAGAFPRLVPYEKPRRESGFHFVDHLMHEARTLVGMQSLTVESYNVRSTINAKLQRAAEFALQEGLARYEENSKRAVFSGPETNLGETVARVDTEQRTRAQRRGRARPIWQIALQNARLPLYDIQWAPAIVIEKRPNGIGRSDLKVGLRDGRIMPLTMSDHLDSNKFKLYDVIYVRVTEGRPTRGSDGRTKSEMHAELRIRPKVQGAVVVLENKTGRILSMVGGFSYPQSQLNRTTQTRRQPGSSIKPVVYLAALHQGLQPNTLVLDAGVTLPPIPGVTAHAWSPKNYDGGGAGTMTLRRALEQSKNLVTARLLDGGVDRDPRRSLELVCEITREARIYNECMKNYPFVLGAQALRMIDLAAFYAAIANEGLRVTPYAIDSIEQNGRAVYRHRNANPTYMAGGDRAAFYQLRTILQGVVERGTAVAMKQHAGFIGGKTGTTDSENDAWFAGFTSDVSVVVWVGYDNAGRRQTLGDGSTGGKVAVPIAEQVFLASWQHVGPKTPLPPPSPEVSKSLKAIPIDVYTGQRVAPSAHAFMEYFRVTGGRVRDTQHALLRGGSVAARPMEDRMAPPPPYRQQYSGPPRTLRELFGLQQRY